MKGGIQMNQEIVLYDKTALHNLLVNTTTTTTTEWGSQSSHQVEMSHQTGIMVIEWRKLMSMVTGPEEKHVCFVLFFWIKPRALTVKASALPGKNNKVQYN